MRPPRLASCEGIHKAILGIVDCFQVIFQLDRIRPHFHIISTAFGAPRKVASGYLGCSGSVSEPYQGPRMAPSWPEMAQGWPQDGPNARKETSGLCDSEISYADLMNLEVNSEFCVMKLGRTLGARKARTCV